MEGLPLLFENGVVGAGVSSSLRGDRYCHYPFNDMPILKDFLRGTGERVASFSASSRGRSSVNSSLISSIYDIVYGDSDGDLLAKYRTRSYRIRESIIS